MHHPIENQQNTAPFPLEHGWKPTSQDPHCIWNDISNGNSRIKLKSLEHLKQMSPSFGRKVQIGKLEEQFKMLGNPYLKQAWVSAAAAGPPCDALSDFQMDVGLSRCLFEDMDALF